MVASEHHRVREPPNLGGMAESTLQALTEVFRNVFDEDDVVLSRELTARDVEGWDSLAHVSLIVEVERRFGVRFSSTEVAHLESVGDLLDLLAAKATRTPTG